MPRKQMQSEAKRKMMAPEELRVLGVFLLVFEIFNFVKLKWGLTWFLCFGFIRSSLSSRKSSRSNRSSRTAIFTKGFRGVFKVFLKFCYS